ncbi:MAG TPA: hypothetical protein VGP63_18880 [Planctomycetaceae bacterium]|jgi:hypothetical protein|nr:hypothetical protein [Planctomycetaceae bacterium]
MGYEIHITRQEESWSEDDPTRHITPEEWQALATADASLRPVPENGPNFFEMVDGDGWFDWSAGCLETKHADEKTLAKACEIAERLNAKVQGDEDELYFADGKVIESGAPPPVPVTTKPRWVDRLGGTMVVVGIILLVIRLVRKFF